MSEQYARRVHRAAEVAQHDLADADPVLAGLVMRAGGVRPGATIAKFTRRWPSATSRRPMSFDTSASVRPTSGMSPRLQLGGDAIGGHRGTTQRGDLGGVLHGAQRAHHLAPLAERGLRHAGLEVDEEAGPRAITDRRGRGVPASLATISTGSSVSSHGTIENSSGCSTRGAPRAEARRASHRRPPGARASSAARAASPRSP